MTQDIFNDYDEGGNRVNICGCRSTRTEDNAIRNNLRQRWQQDLAEVSDVALVNAYDDFALSPLFGNNDEGYVRHNIEGGRCFNCN